MWYYIYGIQTISTINSYILNKFVLCVLISRTFIFYTYNLYSVGFAQPYMSVLLGFSLWCGRFAWLVGVNKLQGLKDEMSEY